MPLPRWERGHRAGRDNHKPRETASGSKLTRIVLKQVVYMRIESCSVFATSKEVVPHIASKMADWKKFSLRFDPMTEVPFGHLSADIPQALLGLAERIHESRIARLKHFDKEIFGEPGWDMLMAVYIAHARGYRMTVTDVCFESRVPQTTALRWLSYIENAGLVERKKKRLPDGRTVLVSLTPEGVAQVNRYLETADEILSRIRSGTDTKKDWRSG